MVIKYYLMRLRIWLTAFFAAVFLMSVDCSAKPNLWSYPVVSDSSEELSAAESGLKIDGLEQLVRRPQQAAHKLIAKVLTSIIGSAQYCWLVSIPTSTRVFYLKYLGGQCLFRSMFLNESPINLANRGRVIFGSIIFADLGISPQVLGYDLEHGLLITEFIPDCMTMAEYTKSDAPQRLGELLKQIHIAPPVIKQLPNLFTVEQPSSYRNFVEKMQQMVEQRPELKPYDDVLKIMHVLDRWLDKVNSSDNIVLTHVDLHPGNILITKQDQWYVIDWETLSVGDPMMDIAYLTSFLQYDEDKINTLLAAYYGYMPTVVEKSRFFVTQQKALLMMALRYLRAALDAGMVIKPIWWTTTNNYQAPIKITHPEANTPEKNLWISRWLMAIALNNLRSQQFAQNVKRLVTTESSGELWLEEVRSILYQTDKRIDQVNAVTSPNAQPLKLVNFEFEEQPIPLTFEFEEQSIPSAGNCWIEAVLTAVNQIHLAINPPLLNNIARLRDEIADRLLANREQNYERVANSVIDIIYRAIENRGAIEGVSQGLRELLLPVIKQARMHRTFDRMFIEQIRFMEAQPASVDNERGIALLRERQNQNDAVWQEFLNGFINESGYVAYCENLRVYGSWGGQLELEILADILGIRIEIYNDGANPSPRNGIGVRRILGGYGFVNHTYTVNPRGSNVIHILHTGGNHYNVLNIRNIQIVPVLDLREEVTVDENLITQISGRVFINPFFLSLPSKWFFA